jgi:hypothetical protein
MTKANLIQRIGGKIAMSHDYVLSFRMPKDETLPDQSLEFSDTFIELRSAMEGRDVEPGDAPPDLRLLPEAAGATVSGRG